MKLKNHYFFTLGRNPILSLVEIVRYFETEDINYQIIDYKKAKTPLLVVKTVKKLKVHNICDILAGSIKAGRLWLKTTPELFEEDVSNSFFYVEDSKKIQFCLDIYGEYLNREEIYEFFREIFKKMKQRAMLKDFQPSQLANAIKRDFFMDIVCIESSNDPKLIFMGRTTSVSDINERKKRYEKRPEVDEIIGTSIRLARILVNFAGVHKNMDTLDPFCGIGTILGEVMLLKGNPHGLEIDHQRVASCKKNLRWMAHRYNLKKNFSIKNGDASQISNFFENGSMDIVVTEPELGPFLRKIPHSHKAEQIISQLRKIYGPFFKKVDSIIKQGGIFVIVLPEIPVKNGKNKRMNISNLIAGTSFQIKRLSLNQKNSLKLPKIETPIIYKDPWHKITRNIYIFEKS